jgi:uncharacterized membrane protein YebE (DUF533 family)
MDVQRLLDGFLGNTPQTGAPQQTNPLGGLIQNLPGGLLGGAAAGGLVAALVGSKKARKLGGKALTYGGLAVLGGLAYKAWRDHKSGAAHPAPGTAHAPASIPDPIPTPDASFDPALLQDKSGEDFRLTLLRAMISAALADGHVDDNEHALITQQIQNSGLAPDEQRFVTEQLSKPADPIAIANLCADEAQAAEVYLASLVVLDDAVPGDARYKQRLGDALRLPDDLRGRLDAQVSAALAQV